MKVVVSDTSPLRALAYLGRLDLPAALLGEVIVPPAVAAELAAADANPRVDLAAVSAVRIVVPSDLAEVSAAAKHQTRCRRGGGDRAGAGTESGSASIDERRGDAAAREAGLRTLGVLGLLLAAKDAGLITALAPLLDALRDGPNFFISDDLREKVLRLGQE